MNCPACSHGGMTHETWDKAEAGKVFGSGVNAFSRYERGESKPSTQMRKLLKIAEKHPELVKELAAIT